MTNKKIEHPLRTISFDWDEKKPEMPFEKELVNAYVKLHDELYSVDRKGSKVVYDFKEIEEDVPMLAKHFSPLKEKIKGFLEELLLVKANNNAALLKDEGFANRIEAYDKQINQFHEEIYLVISEKVVAIEEDYKIFDADSDALNEKVEAFDEGIREMLDDNHENSSIDLCSFDNDEEEFKGAIDKLQEYVAFKEKFIDEYNKVANNINAWYAEGARLQVLINEIRDDQGLLDSTISDSYANGTGEASKKPVYFMEPTDETVKGFKKQFGAIAASEVKTVVISVDVDVIEQGNNVMICELLAGLQHYPRLIEKLIFAIRIDIVDHDGLVLPEDQWKGLPPPMSWYHKLGSMPFALFFFEDHDARAYILMGDLFAGNRFEGDGERVTIQGELLQEVTNRLFGACYFFMIFCHNTGFEPRPYIEAILADFDLPITYEQVKERFEEDLVKGIHLRMVRTNDGEPLA
jgi:hypothetical protein